MIVPRGTKTYQVVVIGAGHAGCEAALGCARLGMATALVTLNATKVAAMSCNPAIGGLGKSQIVREIDALGGEMARAADASAIHYRRLNSSKGPAVRARRVQCDVNLYHRHMLEAIRATSGLELLEASVERVLVEGGEVAGVCLADGSVLNAGAVVVTTGTFLRGLMHVGLNARQGGRIGEPPSRGLSESLEELGLRLGRLKTGTPARLEAASIDFSKCQPQESENPRLAFAHEGSPADLPQLDCFVTRTNEQTHRIIGESLSESPLFTGVIEGRGPRYCPSIEDKVIRFPDRESHQVILEPVTLDAKVIYPNGISTSLPEETQARMIHTIEGLQHARVLEWGYAIEYDYVLPTQLHPSLEAKNIAGLFLAGQINGTSGYEEAAGQGLMAGINAAAVVSGGEQVVIGRHEGYIGVMVDDLVTRGVVEPYRMFSSRAEFRLVLREDNAAARLDGIAERIGLVEEAVLRKRRLVMDSCARLLDELKNTLADKDGRGRRPSYERLLRRPGVKIADLIGKKSLEYPPDVLEQVEVEVKYSGYIERQYRQVERIEREARRRIPPDIEYRGIPGLSNELAEKMSEIRPRTMAQATRVDGMTPAALMALSIWLKKKAVVPRGTQARDASDEA